MIAGEGCRKTCFGRRVEETFEKSEICVQRVRTKILQSSWEGGGGTNNQLSDFINSLTRMRTVVKLADTWQVIVFDMNLGERTILRRHNNWVHTQFFIYLNKE